MNNEVFKIQENVIYDWYDKLGESELINQINASIYKKKCIENSKIELRENILFTDIFNDDLITVLSKMFTTRIDTQNIKMLTKTCKKYNNNIIKMIIWNSIVTERSKINLRYINDH